MGSVAQRKNCSYLAVALASLFLYNERAWRLAKPLVFFFFWQGAMTTQHIEE